MAVPALAIAAHNMTLIRQAEHESSDFEVVKETEVLEDEVVESRIIASTYPMDIYEQAAFLNDYSFVSGRRITFPIVENLR